MRFASFLCVVLFALSIARSANADSTTPEVLEPRRDMVDARKATPPTPPGPESPSRYTRSLATCDAIAVAPTAGLAVFISGAYFINVGALAADGKPNGPQLIPIQKPFEVLPLVAIGSGVGLLTCGPVIHFGHGRFGAGLASLALRAGLPFVAGAITYGVDRAYTQPGDHFLNGWQAAVVGTILIPGAIVTALAIDYAILSHPEAEAPSRASASSLSRLPLPTVSMVAGGASIGLTGRF